MPNNRWFLISLIGLLFIMCVGVWPWLNMPTQDVVGWFPVTTQKNAEFSTPATSPVFLCQRLVDRWLVQMLSPGAEHYSIWLPEQEIHRGVTADWYGQPLYWVDEIFNHYNQPALFPPSLSCIQVKQADAYCVEHEIYRQRDEGNFSLTNHCQQVVIDILAICGGEMPVIVPEVHAWQF